jgi:hypothetical protein
LGRVTEHVREQAEKMLLDLLMPNGKALRDCTGAECDRFGKADEQRGRWLQRVAAEVGPTRRVGDVLGEKQLKTLMRATVAFAAKP